VWFGVVRAQRAGAASSKVSAEERSGDRLGGRVRAAIHSDSLPVLRARVWASRKKSVTMGSVGRRRRVSR